MKKILLALGFVCVLPVMMLVTGCAFGGHRVRISTNTDIVSITASHETAKQGELVTLYYSLENQDYVFNGFIVEGQKITGNTFTMPATTVTVQADVTRVKYNINFHMGDGEIANNPNKYSIQENNLVLNDGVKDGHIFVGWYETSNFNSPKITQIDKNSKKNYNLYPKFVSLAFDGEYRLIKTPVDFMELLGGDTSGKYKLASDLDFSGFVLSGINQNGFTGELDGNNKTIKNANIVGKDKIFYLGLFNTLDGADIYNLNIKDSTVVSLHATYIGGLAGDIKNSTISNVKIENVVVSENRPDATIGIGGMSGYVSSSQIEKCTIKNCSLGAISGNIRAGALAGYVKSSTINEVSVILDNNTSINLNATKTSLVFGGVVGEIENNSHTQIKNTCISQDFNSKVTLTLENSDTLGNSVIQTGGLVGFLGIGCSIQNSYAKLYKFEVYEQGEGNINSLFGGIVGLNNSSSNTIDKCFVIGTKTGASGDLFVYLPQVDGYGYISGNGMLGVHISGNGCANETTTVHVDGCYAKNNYVDTDTTFIIGVDIASNAADDIKVIKLAYDEFKDELNWNNASGGEAGSNSIWDFSNLLPSLKYF